MDVDTRCCTKVCKSPPVPIRDRKGCVTPPPQLIHVHRFPSHGDYGDEEICVYLGLMSVQHHITATASPGLLE